MRKTLVIMILFASFAFAESQKPFNRIVVIIDSSGSFKEQQYEAIEKTRKLLEEIAKRRERRYEASDEIYIISLDARPEVIWAGKRTQLEQLTKEKLDELSKKRKKYNQKTYISYAFNLAGYKLNREPIPTDKWLFIFSDLINDPPGSDHKPKIPSPPPEDIMWDKLTDVKMAAFWVPDQQIMAWENSLADKKISIKFYDEAESLNIKLSPPTKARKEMTEEERKKARERIVRWIRQCKSIGIKLLLGITIFVGFVISLAFAGRYFAHHRLIDTNSRRR